GFQTLDLSVTEWSVTIKEEMHQKNAKQILRHLNRDYYVTKTDDANSFTYQAAYTHKATESDVNFVVIVPKNTYYKPEFIASINGHNWDTSNNTAYNLQLKAIKQEYFSEQSNIFACITGEVHGTISDVYFMN